MADAQSVKLGNKELEKVKAREETADTLIANEAPSPAEGSSDISGMDDEKKEGEEGEDSLGSSHLLEKLAQIKISEQKLEKEFNSLILKGPASSRIRYIPGR